MKKALIISLNFRAAHVSHLVASYQQLKELGYEPYCYVHPDFIRFLPLNINFITTLKNIKEIDLSIFWFPSVKNIREMINLKLTKKSKIIYVYHEPFENFSAYLNSGNSLFWTIKFYIKYLVGLSFLPLVNSIILPSKKAILLYKKRFCSIINPNFHYLPLMYSDESNNKILNKPRKFISYIGGISKDHAFPEFIDFIYNAYINNMLRGFKFLIASWRKVEKDERIEEMEKANILEIFDGKPMTDDEINDHYASSILVWNAYNRSTQSGVLAKAFMFGTPAIISRKNISEFIEDGKEVIAVENNKDFAAILEAVESIIHNFEYFSNNARKCFENNFFYKVHNTQMSNIIN